MVTWDRVKQALDCWDNMFPEAKYDELRLTDLADVYHAELSGEKVTPLCFEVICKMANKRNRFFPKIADLLAYKEEYGKSPEQYVAPTKAPQIGYAGTTYSTEAILLMKKIIYAAIGKEITGGQSNELNDAIFAKHQQGDDDYSDIEARLDALRESKQYR